MVSFTTKKIKTESTVGEVLESTRNSKGIYLNEVSKEIKVSKDYLLWLENGEYDKLPGEVYTKNFIKIYGSFLGIDSDELSLLYKREVDVYNNIQKGREKIMRDPVRFLSWFHFLSTPKILRNSVIMLAVFIFLLYFGIKVEAIMRPPELMVVSPRSDVLIDTNSIDIRGSVTPGSRVAINGQNILVNPNGSFLEKINVSSGINEIRISAKRDHSKEAMIIRRVVVKEKE